MATAEVELKSPFVPLFQRGNFLRAMGRFSNRMTLELYSELLGQDTSWCSGIVRSDADIGMTKEERKNG
jgi:hypothetical protein